MTTPLPRRRRGAVRIHHSRTLTDADRTLEQGIPVTSVARTALDLAAILRSRNLRRLIRRSEELRVFDLGDFHSVLDRNRGHRGRLPLERALAIYEPPRFTRSELEREFVSAAEWFGLAQPVTAFNFAGHELDVYWPELRFAVELDVYATHGGHDPFEADRLRDEDLKLAGVELTRVTGRRFEREPRRVMERVALLLDQRREQLGLEAKTGRQGSTRPPGGAR